MSTSGGRSAYDKAQARRLWELNRRYDSYGGELGWSAWLAKERRYERLDRLGIEPPTIPDAYANALGPERTERLKRLIENRLEELTISPEEPGKLVGQANRLPPLAQPWTWD